MGGSLFAGVGALPAPNDPLLSADDFAEWFNLGNGTAGSLTALEQARIQTALEIASADCRGETHQRLDVITETIIRHPWSSDSFIILPEWPVSAINSLQINAMTLTDGQDFVWTDRGIITPLTWGWWSPRDTVTINYTHGWSPVPRDLAGVVLSRAKRLYDQPNDQQIDAETLGNWSVKYAPLVDGFTPAECEILKRYASWTSGY